MIKKIVIRNKSSLELGVMLEPWTDRDDVQPNKSIEINVDFTDEDELVIDIGDDNFISLWTPPGSNIKEENS